MRDVRIFFSKKGRMKFASHLDMNRLMSRILRLSRIPIWYTEGFNQHPYITFALPLSLGFTSEYEIMDIRIIDDSYTNEMAKSALSAVLPEGLNVIDVCDRGLKAGQVAFAEFMITFESSDDSFAESLETFLSKETIITQKKTKKGNFKDIDIAPFIKKYEINKDNEVVFKIVLSAGSENNINPTLLLSAYGDTPDYSICRTMIYNSSMECFK